MRGNVPAYSALPLGIAVLSAFPLLKPLNKNARGKKLTGACGSISGIFRALTGLGLTLKTSPSPAGYFDGIAEGSALLCSLRSEPSHYATGYKRSSSATGCRVQREIRSKRLDNLHYGGADTRSITASNQPLSRTRQSGYDGDRRAEVCIEERSRKLQARHRWKAEAEEVPPQVLSLRSQLLVLKIRGGNEPQQRIAEQMRKSKMKSTPC